MLDKTLSRTTDKAAFLAELLEDSDGLTNQILQVLESQAISFRGEDPALHLVWTPEGRAQRLCSCTTLVADLIADAPPPSSDLHALRGEGRLELRVRLHVEGVVRTLHAGGYLTSWLPLSDGPYEFSRAAWLGPIREAHDAGVKLFRTPAAASPGSQTLDCEPGDQHLKIDGEFLWHGAENPLKRGTDPFKLVVLAALNSVPNLERSVLPPPRWNPGPPTQSRARTALERARITLEDKGSTARRWQWWLSPCPIVTDAVLTIAVTEGWLSSADCWREQAAATASP